MIHPRTEARRGQVFVIVALALVVLVGAVGLAIDGGRLFLERRKAQGAADHAATAAAYANCSGADWEEEGLQAAARNGFDDDSPLVSVTVTDEGSNRFRAIVSASSGTTFIGVLGIPTFQVAAQALAGCIGGTTGPDPGAIFAGGGTCVDPGKYTFSTSGSGQRVFGGIHSNADVSIGTKPNWWTDDGVGDPFTYSGQMKPGEPVSQTFDRTATQHNVFQEADPAPGYPKKLDTNKSWPTGWSPTDVATRLSDYREMAEDQNHYFTSKITGSDITEDGVYYSTQEIELGSIDDSYSVTLVSEKSIKLSASGTPSTPWTLSPYVDGLLAFSGFEKPADKKCDEYTIELGGSDMNWEGIVWAPGGLVNFPGSSNATLKGTVIAWAVRFGGSDIHIESDPSLFGNQPGDVLLYE